MRRYHVTTFGCQMNAHDSERIKGMLEELGLGEAPDQDEADVLVFNTCTIREKPDQRFAAHLAQARALKKRDPEKVIAVGGCYAGTATPTAVTSAATSPSCCGRATPSRGSSGFGSRARTRRTSAPR